jgi:hypothetical protein
MAKQERSFSYKPRNKDSVKERANMKGGNYDSYIKPKFKQWKPKDGKNIIRILPPTWDDANHYGLDIYINWGIGADNQTYLSLSKHGKGADPIAEARLEAQREGNSDLAKELNPRQRILYWVIDRNDEEEGPLLWAAPFTFDKSLSNLCIDEDTKAVIFIDDPNKGRDVRFYKEGTGLNTSYDASKMKVLAASSIHEDEGIQAEWLEFITENPLPEVLNFYEYDHIKAVFDGKAQKPADDDDDEAPVKSKVSSLKRKAVEDDDEEAQPSRRARSRDTEPAEQKVLTKRKSADPDDDNGDLEDLPPPRSVSKVKPRARVVVDADDEEDEAPPTKSRRGNDDDEDEGGSLRERLAARRRRQSDDEDDE